MAVGVQYFASPCHGSRSTKFKIRLTWTTSTKLCVLFQYGDNHFCTIQRPWTTLYMQIFSIAYHVSSALFPMSKQTSKIPEGSSSRSSDFAELVNDQRSLTSFRRCDGNSTLIYSIASESTERKSKWSVVFNPFSATKFARTDVLSPFARQNFQKNEKRFNSTSFLKCLLYIIRVYNI